jgi:ABC-type spermidine/putrescine transport system permease subunit II
MRATVTPTLAAVGSVLVVISTMGLVAIRILRQERASHD